MLGYRKKILLSDLVLFLIFISILFPFIRNTVGGIVQHSIAQRANELISRLKKEPDASAMVSYLEQENKYVFYRATLFDRNGEVLYDTHLESSDQEMLVETGKTPEVENAIKYGQGYSERFTALFNQVIAYAAFSFEADHEEYILRIGFPFTELKELTNNFEIGFLILGGVILLLYSMMTWAIMHRLSLPIQQIITAIEPYQAGKQEYLPRIEIDTNMQGNDEFFKLAHTLNSLNSRIQKQFEHLERQNEETEAILESLGEGVIAVDIEGVVVFANQVATKMLQTPREEILHRKFSEIKAQRHELVQECSEIIKAAQERAEIVVQTFTIEEGQRFYFDLIASPVKQHSGSILVLQDKTSDYRIVEMGKDFIANASHELRTPITIIRGFAETLNDLPDLSQEMLKEITEKIVRTCHRLDSLVKSLLTLTDIENLSDERLLPVDVVLICDNCKHIILTAHPNAKVNLHKGIEKGVVLADPDLLEMAVINLLQNAVKYSPAPAQIDLSVNAQGKQIIIRVEDHGIGIPEADLPHIFNRFYTVDKARSRKFGGTGLGLSIVKTIVQKHKGTIQVASQLGHGTTFTISLPVEH